MFYGDGCRNLSTVKVSTFGSFRIVELLSHTCLYINKTDRSLMRATRLVVHCSPAVLVSVYIWVIWNQFQSQRRNDTYSTFGSFGISFSLNDVTAVAVSIRRCAFSRQTIKQFLGVISPVLHFHPRTCFTDINLYFCSSSL